MKQTFMHARLTGAVVLCAILGGCVSTPVPEVPRAREIPTATTFTPERPRVDGAIYNSNNNLFLFEDVRARRVGDVLNVILEERTDATKTASTSSNKGSTVNVLSPTLFGKIFRLQGRDVLNNDLSSSTQFSGAADSTQSNRLSGGIAVTVSRVLDNGNLWIDGEKILTLNQGSEVVRVSGQIRAADIAPDNTIRSSQIANARITYGGTGLLADSNNAGWLTRFFHSPFWPF